MLVPAGWYPDPWKNAAVRWFDGQSWTAELSNRADWYPDPYQQAAARWFDGNVWTALVPPPSASFPVAQSTGVLTHLLGGAEAIAVVDVETTGLGRYDKVTEIGVVVIDASAQVIDEFETLINPMRDVGPTWLHGITASMVTEAPTFEEIAGTVAQMLSGRVIAAHNVRFDTRILDHELTDCGFLVDWGQTVDTLTAVHAKLGVACADLGITLDDAHSALADARATAHLLARTADRFLLDCSPANLVGDMASTASRIVCRSGQNSTEVQAVPFIAEVTTGLRPDADLSSYELLLARALDDLRLTGDEESELAELACDLGMSSSQVHRAHRQFLHQAIDQALDDGIVTDDEMDELLRVEVLLALEPGTVIRKTNPYRSEEVVVPLESSLTVCFTGDGGVDSSGRTVRKAEVMDCAERAGLTVIDAVRKTGCGLLVASDPASMSTKARSAQKFGVPITGVTAFLTAVRAGAPVEATLFDRAGVANVCEHCGDSWVAARRTKRCCSCRQK